MKEPTLIIMAAGMGSRFGGLKQITPVDPQGHNIMDFSLYDAYKAGFRKVAFVIKEENAADFKKVLNPRIFELFETHFVFQKLQDIPEGFSIPENRVKPWGTAHATRSCRNVVDGPFVVINADDYYGAGAFEVMYQFLTSDHPDSEQAMVGYPLRNTVTEHGHVARGLCAVEKGYLTHIEERTHIEKRGSDAAYTEDGETFTPVAGDTPVSMNFWGFNAPMMGAFTELFREFLTEDMPKNPEKAEYFLPAVVEKEMRAGRARVRVLPCNESWHGVTYREDLPSVQQAIANMKAEGKYPDELWK